MVEAAVEKLDGIRNIFHTVQHLNHMYEVKFLVYAFLFHLLFILRRSELVPNKGDTLQIWSLINQLFVSSHMLWVGLYNFVVNKDPWMCSLQDPDHFQILFTCAAPHAQNIYHRFSIAETCHDARHFFLVELIHALVLR